MTDSHPNTSHRFWMVKYVVWLLVAAPLLLYLVLPLLTTYALENDIGITVSLQWIDALQYMQAMLMRVFVYLWITFLGSCLASFLNVVAWRVPRGRGILGASHCPHCDGQLSMRDNVPIFGWLNTNGQCRNCAAPITIRYLLVELLLGLIFLLLFTVEIVWGGSNLPVPPRVVQTGIEFLVLDPHWPLVMTFVFHTTLMCGLFTIALIAIESKPIPISVMFFAAIFPAAIASTYPHVIQVPWTALVSKVLSWPPSDFSTLPLETMAIGVAAGLIAGVAAFAIEATLQGVQIRKTPSETEEFAESSLPPQASLTAMGTGMALVGLTLGWQSVICVFVLWCLCKLILSLTSSIQSRRFLSCGAVVLMFATILHIVFWRLQMPASLWLTSALD